MTDVSAGQDADDVSDRYKMTEEKGWTFNMNFMVLRARDWRLVLDLTDLAPGDVTPQTSAKFFNNSRYFSFDNDKERWGMDQVRALGIK